MKRAMLLAAFAMAGLAAPAMAQEKPCMADAARLCAGTEPGGGAQLTCLKAHKEELSPACKKNVMKMKIKNMEQQQLEQQRQGAQPPQTP